MAGPDAERAALHFINCSQVVQRPLLPRLAQQAHELILVGAVLRGPEQGMQMDGRWAVSRQSSERGDEPRQRLLRCTADGPRRTVCRMSSCRSPAGHSGGSQQGPRARGVLSGPAVGQRCKALQCSCCSPSGWLTRTANRFVGSLLGPLAGGHGTARCMGGSKGRACLASSRRQHLGATPAAGRRERSRHQQAQAHKPNSMSTVSCTAGSTAGRAPATTAGPSTLQAMCLLASPGKGALHVKPASCHALRMSQAGLNCSAEHARQAVATSSPAAA